MSDGNDSDHLGFWATAGDITVFGWRSLRGLRYVGDYAAEALRQATIIATGSVLVMMFVAFLAGGSCGLQSTSLARSFGTDPVGAGFTALCTLREVIPFVFGYILAAKVGCGMTAELGAMRVNQEVDALVVMGVRSITFLATTRIVGAALVLPLAYALSVASAYGGAYLMSAKRFGDVSEGTWELFFFLFQDPYDFLFSVTKGVVIAVFVVTVALYFGYRVRGGPVEVGQAVARSMAINVIGVTLISAAGTLVFWGANARLPFG